MKRHILLLFAVFCWVWMVAGCGSGTDGGNTGQNNEPAVREMQEDQTLSGSVQSIGEVDRYHFRAVDTNAIMEITLTSQHYNADVEFLVNVYEDTGNGTMTRLYGDHSPENGALPANLKMRLFINQPKDIYIHVRDLMDDESGTVPYFLTVRMVEMPEENNSFANATAMTVGGGSPGANTIGYTGDKDVYTFDVATDGVFEVDTVFTPFGSGTTVDLAVHLYDESGHLIQSLSNISGNHYEILAYLTVINSPYYVVVEDAGSDDFDESSSFNVEVLSVAATEMFENDDAASASAMSYAGGTQTFSVSGSLEYGSSSTAAGNDGDQDWYAVPVDTVTTTEDFKTLTVNFDDGSVLGNDARYQLVIQDANEVVLLSHEFAGGSQAYESQIRSGTGAHLAKVSVISGHPITAAAPYDLSIAVVGVDDADEANGGNNTESDAIAIFDRTARLGKICYRGDVDWYQITFDASAPRILSLDFTGFQSDVDYSVNLLRGTTVLKKLYDSNGSDADTALGTSIYVPAAGGDVTYLIKVSDFQNDDGADTTYSLTASVDSIPASVSAMGSEATNYANETDEQDQDPNAPGAGWTYTQLEVFSDSQPEFAANTSLLDFRAASPTNGVVKTLNQDGTTTIEFPWIAGHVDYQRDVDFFQVDFDMLNPAAPDTEWYYSIQTRLVVAADSDVEYVWKLYRDSNGNGIIMDNPTATDGYFAINGDTQPEVTTAVDAIDPQGSQLFWVGKDWGDGDAQFFFGVSDFEYLQIPSTGLDNPDLDADWGYGVNAPPYYLKVILTYHPGLGRPPE